MGRWRLAQVRELLVPVSEGLSERLDVRAGDRALDVATGSGNTALACARRGCVVTGVDFVSGSLEHARRRAAAEALTMTFVAGDAELLPFATASFDVVVSTFGAMFAPDRASAAAELLRVCRPGGTIGLATFPPEGVRGRPVPALGSVRPAAARCATGDPLGDRGGDRRPVRSRRRTDRVHRPFLRVPLPLPGGVAGVLRCPLRAGPRGARGASRRPTTAPGGRSARGTSSPTTAPAIRRSTSMSATPRLSSGDQAPDPASVGPHSSDRSLMILGSFRSGDHRT